MARQTINVGAVANDGTGDIGPRAWLQKYEANFAELYGTGPANLALPLTGVCNIKSFGAKCDGSDDTPAWTAAIAAAAVAKTYVFHPGGVSGISALTLPPLNNTRIIGSGAVKSTLKDISGAGLIINFSTHLSNEWAGSFENLTIDGGGFAGPLLNISRASFFLLRNVILSNCTGTVLQFTSLWDCWIQNVFVSDYLGPIGTTASAVVFDTVSSPAGQEFDHNTIIGLHIEAAFPNAQQPLVFNGNATNTIRYNRFVDLKVHADPNAGTPATNLIYLSPNTVDNEIHGLKMASGNAAPQLRIDGHRNVLFGGQANTGTALKATAAVSLVGNDNRIYGISLNDTTYSTAQFLVSGARNRIIEPIVNTGGPVLANTGTDTVFQRSRPGTSADRGDASIGITPITDIEEQLFATALTANRNCDIGAGTSGSQQWPGARFRVIRSGGGAFSLALRGNAGPALLRQMPPNSWAEATFGDTGGWKCTAWGPLLGTLAPFYQNSGLTTTSTSDASIGSLTLFGGVLANNGQMLRMTARGRQTTQAGSFNIKFGATVLGTVAPAAGETWEYEVTLTRTGAATQLVNGRTIHGTTMALITAAPAETLSGNIVIDFRGSVTSGGTLSLDEALIE